MSIRTFACALALSATTCPALAADELYGTWKLVSFTQEVVATGQKTNVFGNAPKGFISYSRDGRMYAILAKDERPKPTEMSKATSEQRVELFNTMAAYAGTFVFDGKTVTHNVDISWNENWTGTAQKRNVKIDGNKLSITTTIPSGIDGKPVVLALEWEKVAP